MAPYSNGDGMNAHHSPMPSFGPSDFHEPHDLHQQYPAWQNMEINTTNISSLNIYPETLDPALYQGGMYPSSTAPLDQHLPFQVNGPNGMPFGQDYQDNSWHQMPQSDVMSWPHSGTESTSNLEESATPFDANANMHNMLNRPHPTSAATHPPSTDQQHRQQQLHHNQIASILQERGRFGKAENRQTAGKIADKSQVKSILGNMQRMDIRYRSYAREHLLDMDGGTRHATDRKGRLHHTFKKRHRARGDSKKRKCGDLAA